MKISRFANVVMNHLCSSTWKTVLELEYEIREERKKGWRWYLYALLSPVSKNFANACCGPSPAKIYPSLLELEGYRLIESRWQPHAGDVWGPRTREYLLTRNGLGVRIPIQLVKDPKKRILLPAGG